MSEPPEPKQTASSEKDDSQQTLPPDGGGQVYRQWIFMFVTILNIISRTSLHFIFQEEKEDKKDSESPEEKSPPSAPEQGAEDEISPGEREKVCFFEPHNKKLFTTISV